MLRLAFRGVRFLLAVAALGVAASAQCGLTATATGPQPQLAGEARCTVLWDPDGAGPAPQVLVVGGQALRGGAVGLEQRVMTWDGVAWAALGDLGAPDVTKGVHALAVWNGLLVAGGDFTGGGHDRIALWSGTQWLGLGPGFPVSVRALTVFNGSLVAAGFDVTATVNVPYLQRWNGVSWVSLPLPPLLDTPWALTTFQSLLFVGGEHSTTSQGVLERWNGTAWQASITANAPIECFAGRSASLTSWLYVGGQFTAFAGGAANGVVGTSNGAAPTWSAIGSPGACDVLLARSTGALTFEMVAHTANAATPNLRWNGSTWVPMGSAIRVESLAYYAGSYHAAVVPPSFETGSENVCRRFDGTSWVPVRGPGTDGAIHAATAVGADVVVGGAFTTLGTTSVNHIARWDGSTFQLLGPGLTGSSVDALVTLANGDVVAGGQFTQAGGTALANIGRWDGNAWSALGSGTSDRVLAVCRMPNGDLVVGGKFLVAGGQPCSHVARWDGVAWSPLGGGMNGDVLALAARSDGVLFAGGLFTTAGGQPRPYLAQWDGAQWQNVGAGVNGGVHGLAVAPNGDLAAVGEFTSAGGMPAHRCARWSGVAWTSMGTQNINLLPVRAVTSLPNGDFVVGRGFHGAGLGDEGLSRWNGTGWSSFVDLSGATWDAQVDVRTLVQSASGDLVVGGEFSIVDGAFSRNLTSIRSTCMPTVLPYGSGCTAAGPLVLTADALPWLGAPFRTTTTGLATQTLCLGVIGFTATSIPLSALLAQGQPGCSLLASPDLLIALLPGVGSAHSSLALGSSPSLLGGQFFQQTIPLEFDALGGIVAVRGSNALAATIGAL